MNTKIYADIGNNHNGSLVTAKELIKTAKECGVSAVKSQKRDIKTLLSKEEYDRPYNSPHSYGETYGKHREALELSSNDWIELFSYSRKIGIDFFASPWDIPSARLLNDLECPIFKIASAMVTNYKLLEEIATYNKKIILSTGMSTIEDIDKAVEILKDKNLIILQCTSAYPTEAEDVNLNVMKLLLERYKCDVGLSGHHRGIAIDIAAVAMGAKVIERHFTLDRSGKGSDHAASLEPTGLCKLVRDIRAVEKSFGSYEKKVLECEKSSIIKLRRV